MSATDAAETSRPVTWRMSVPARWCAVAAAGLGVAAGGAWADESAVLGAAIAAASVLFVWRGFLIPRVTLRGRVVEVVNPWGRTTFEVDHLTSVEPGYAGTVLTLTDGHSVLAWAVQRTNVA